MSSDDAGGVAIVARHDVLVAAEPLGDVVSGEVAAGTTVTALCFVAEARTNAGIVGSAVRIRAGGWPATPQ